MFNDGSVNKLIIVCTKETKKYGAYLVKLISLKDDDGDTVIGVKDGSVEAVLWSEKDYEDNRPTLPSSAQILFIGDSKLIKQESFGLENAFDQYGMKFSALGNRAIMSVDNKALKRKEYEKFIEFCKDYGKITVEKYSSNDMTTNAAAAAVGGAAGAAGAATATAVSAAGVAATHTAAATLAGGTLAWGSAGVGTTLGMAGALGVLGPIALVGIGAGATAGTIKAVLSSLKRNAKIHEEQYRFLVHYSYMELISKFLEG